MIEGRGRPRIRLRVHLTSEVNIAARGSFRSVGRGSLVQLSKKLEKMSSSSDEFDYGLVNTDEIEIQPFQFERLSGASKRGRRGARSRKRCRPNSAVLVQGTEIASRYYEASEDEEFIGDHPTSGYVLYYWFIQMHYCIPKLHIYLLR